MALSRRSQCVANHAPASTIGAHHAYLARITAHATPPIISTMPLAMKSIEIASGGPGIPPPTSRAPVGGVVLVALSKIPMPGGGTDAFADLSQHADAMRAAG